MRALLSWLMVLGVFVGLSARVFALDHVHVKAGVEKCSTACACDHEDPDNDGGHDGNCPPEPHSHHCECTHGMPLPPVGPASCRVALPDFSRAGVDWVEEQPPEEPVFALDKPPLI